MTYDAAAGFYVTAWAGEIWSDWDDDYIDAVMAARVLPTGSSLDYEPIVLDALAPYAETCDVGYDPAIGQTLVVWDKDRGEDWDVYYSVIGQDDEPMEPLPLALGPGFQFGPALSDAGSDGRFLVV